MNIELDNLTPVEQFWSSKFKSELVNSKQLSVTYHCFPPSPACEVDNNQAPVRGRLLREVRRVAVPRQTVAQDSLPQRLNEMPEPRSLLSPAWHFGQPDWIECC